jgi:hypothetical protein
MRRKSQSSGASKPVKVRWTAKAIRALAKWPGNGKFDRMGSWLLIAVSVVSLMPTGCGANRNNRPVLDPLFGTAPGPTATRPTGNAAAAPVPAGSVSNAALVNGSPMQPPPYAPVGASTPIWQPQPGVAPAQPIQPTGQPIQPTFQPMQPGGQPLQPQPTYQPIQPTGQPLQPQPGYQPIQPMGQPIQPPPPNLTPMNPMAQPVPRVASYDHAQGVLASLGVKWQRLESGQDGVWTFVCSVPRRENPAIARTYEGRALTYLAAVQAVLDQIGQDRQ